MITAENLTKRYHHHIAVDDVSFTCEPGTVTGFLGPNGAGKSTTLRMLTGLTPPTAGRVAIDGLSYAELPNPGRMVGVMLDAAAQHPGRTGLETLRITARLLDLVVGLVDGPGAAGLVVALATELQCRLGERCLVVQIAIVGPRLRLGPSLRVHELTRQLR